MAAAPKIFRLIPTKDGYWYVSRLDEAMRLFPTKQMALDYAHVLAARYKPSALVEVANDGRELGLAEFR